MPTNNVLDFTTETADAVLWRTKLVAAGFLESAGTQGGFELAQVFGQFRRPGHAPCRAVPGVRGSGLRRARPDAGNRWAAGVVPSAIFRVIRAVADQRQPGVGGLDADLMFAAGLQPEPQFGDEAFAAGERIFRDDFVVRDGFAGLVARRLCLALQKGRAGAIRPRSIAAIAARCLWADRPAFHEGHVFALHGVRLQLLDEVWRAAGFVAMQKTPLVYWSRR